MTKAAAEEWGTIRMWSEHENEKERGRVDHCSAFAHERKKKVY